ncbi:hypothetical protein NDU88_003654 [Pleurodeles waltl]|uniref:Uncharacterized protein n=1 Tax=Pleurodeles waltl TaxID=8319 RepID=A0AAV7WPP7_PLEWA|nr:hypothetical protein NDU88_003654 [Pleurodeles waltl]
MNVATGLGEATLAAADCKDSEPTEPDLSMKNRGYSLALPVLNAGPRASPVEDAPGDDPVSATSNTPGLLEALETCGGSMGDQWVSLQRSPPTCPAANTSSTFKRPDDLKESSKLRESDAILISLLWLGLR